MVASLFREEARPRVELQGTPCDDVGPPSVIECGKQQRLRVSTCSTAASADSSSGSDFGGSDTAESGDGTIDRSCVNLSSKFRCPHCCQQFETEEALYQHDKCMNMPSEVVDSCSSGNGTILSVGVKLSGKIQCPDCSQKFDTVKALSLHCKFIHERGSLMNVGYTLVYEFKGSKHIDA